MAAGINFDENWRSQKLISVTVRSELRGVAFRRLRGSGADSASARWMVDSATSQDKLINIWYMM